MSAVNLLDVGVSRRALSIARMIDRLPPGKFNLLLVKGEGEGERWQIEIAQPVTLQKKDLVHEPTERTMSNADLLVQAEVETRNVL